LAKALERAGIPTAHVCSIVPVALMVGSNRIVNAKKIVNPLGDAGLEPADEKSLRRAIIENALVALQTDINEQTLFDQNN
jgi:glycine reductase complex component B subunit gamma